MVNPLMLEQRVVELEIKLAFQEDLTAELNKIVAQQQQKISDLERICHLLYERIDHLAARHSDNMVDEPPPHY